MNTKTTTMNYFLRALGTLPLLALLTISLTTARAAELQVAGSAPYACASVQGCTTINGTPVLLYSCGDGPPQQWNYNQGELTGIGTANGLSTCLEVNGTESGAPVVISSCNGSVSQQWRFQVNNVISMLAGNLCLDSSPGLDNQLVVNACTPAATQNWNTRGMEIQLNSSAPYKCFSLEGSLTANGTPVLSYSCDDGPAQQWYFSAGQIVGLGTNGTNIKCLTAASNAAASLVELSACTGEATQQWLMAPGSRIGVAAGAFIQLGDSDLCVDSSGGARVGLGTELVLNTCTGAASQNWLVR
jgi:hypothetical protein